jgi:hypothetical protein
MNRLFVLLLLVALATPVFTDLAADRAAAAKATKVAAPAKIAEKKAELLKGAQPDKLVSNTADPCAPVPTADWAAVKACLSHQIGTARTVPETAGIAVPGHGRCALGYHKLDKWCHPNTAYCSDKSYDAQTFNCFHCKWYAFQVQGDLTRFPDFTGDYCQTNWWWFIFLCFLALAALLLFIGLLAYLCCRPKAKKTPAPVYHKPAKPARVEVETEHIPIRQESGPVKEWRDPPVVTEHRSGQTYGQRVHVETRTYSPNREVQRVSHGHEDWAKWSSANWQGH